MTVHLQKVAEASRRSSIEDQKRDASATFAPAQRPWLGLIKNYVALNGAFATDDQDAYLDACLDARQSVGSDKGVPLAVANRVFGKDALKPCSSPDFRSKPDSSQFT